MKTVLKRIGIILLLLIVLGVVLHIVSTRRSASRVAEIQAAFAAAGRPLTAEAVIPPEVPEADNAAPLYSEAYKLLEQVEQEHEGAKHLLESEPSTIATNLPAIQAFLADTNIVRAIELIQEGAAKPACRYDCNYLSSPNLDTSGLMNVRQLQRLAVLQASVLMQEGKTPESYAAYETAIALCDALRNEPLLIGHLVRVGQIEITLEALEQDARVAPPNEAQARPIITRLSTLLNKQDMHRAFDGERLLFGEWIFNLRNQNGAQMQALIGGGPSAIPLQLYGSALTRPIFNADHQAYLEHMLNYTLRIDQPYDPVLLDNEDLDPPKLAIFTALIAPALGSCLKKFTEVEAHIAIAQLALETMVQGAVPGELPIDPFGQQALKVNGNADEGWRFYSVGPDMADDGGDEEKDVVWGAVGSK